MEEVGRVYSKFLNHGGGSAGLEDARAGFKQIGQGLKQSQKWREARSQQLAEGQTAVKIGGVDTVAPEVCARHN